MDISIHALHEEGDSAVSVTPAQFNVFLSTPSMRRATRYFFIVVCIMPISIHALHEEGDYGTSK